jgi:hypothetical protein
LFFSTSATAFCPLILNQFGGVADDAERCIHHLLITEQAKPGALCHLPAGKGPGQFRRVFPAIRYLHGRQLGLFFRLGCRLSPCQLRQGQHTDCQCNRLDSQRHVFSK